MNEIDCKRILKMYRELFLTFLDPVPSQTFRYCGSPPPPLSKNYLLHFE
jgi:hypothetical protein